MEERISQVINLFTRSMIASSIWYCVNRNHSEGEVSLYTCQQRDRKTMPQKLLAIMPLGCMLQHHKVVISQQQVYLMQYHLFMHMYNCENCCLFTFSTDIPTTCSPLLAVSVQRNSTICGGLVCTWPFENFSGGI